MDHAEIRRRFNHYPAGPEREQTLAEIRRRYGQLALNIATVTPVGREQALALADLETSLFWATEALARPEQAAP